VNESQLKDAAAAVLQDSGCLSATISLAVIDDETMHELNRRHLDHDYPTDVLSFVLEDDGDHLEGEVILSADTAASLATQLGHSAAEEQLLYVIHGMLHLVGYDDKSTAEAEEMRAAEERYLQQFGVELSRRAAP
jgi:probable rRNA maturation factor